MESVERGEGSPQLLCTGDELGASLGNFVLKLEKPKFKFNLI